jgi:hypothetical protein
MAKTAAQLDAEIKAALNGAKHGVIGRAKTYDDKVVLLHSDGTLTWALGNAIKGSPNARTAAAIEEARAAGWLVLGEVSIVNADDVSRLIAAARKVARKGGLPGDVRKELHKAAPLKPHWATLEADRNGKATLRVWVLPRLSHPGLAVWDELRGSNGRGRYRVMQQMGRGRNNGRGSDTYAPTGVQFHELASLQKYLNETSQLAQ